MLGRGRGEREGEKTEVGKREQLMRCADLAAAKQVGTWRKRAGWQVWKDTGLGWAAQGRELTGWSQCREEKRGVSSQAQMVNGSVGWITSFLLFTPLTQVHTPNPPHLPPSRISLTCARRWLSSAQLVNKAKPRPPSPPRTTECSNDRCENL